MELKNPILPGCCDSENEIQHQEHRSHSVNIPSFLFSPHPCPCSHSLPTSIHLEVFLLLYGEIYRSYKNYIFFFLPRPPMFSPPLILGASKVGRYMTFCRVSEAVTQSPGQHSQFFFACFIWRLTPGLGAQICVMHCTASCTQIQLKGEKTRLRLVQGIDFPSCPCPTPFY